MLKNIELYQKEIGKLEKMANLITLEAQYVKKTVGKWTRQIVNLTINSYLWLEFFLFKGPALKQGLAEIVEKRPADPIEYLANFLLKFAENKNDQELVRAYITFFFQFVFLINKNLSKRNVKIKF